MGSDCISSRSLLSFFTLDAAFPKDLVFRLMLSLGNKLII